MSEPVAVTSVEVPEEHKRRILTFMKRSSAFTTSQKQGLEQYGSRYLLNFPDQKFNQEAVFGRLAPLTVEIGFGMGYSLIEMAKAAPERDFIGIEIHPNGLAQICYEAGSISLPNLRVMDADALLALEHYFPDACMDTVQLYFADPWPKKKHHKRRFVQKHIMQLIRRKLKTSGVFHAATDWQPYAEWMLEILEVAEGFENMAGPGQYAERPAFRPLTKFENRGNLLGHGVWDLLYRKVR